MDERPLSIETKAIHAGEPRPRAGGAVVMPIYQSSTYEYEGGSDYHAVRYIRLNNNPNQAALSAKIAALENAEAALVAGSGMAAISAALLSVLSTGDHLLALECLYGGTHGFVTKDLPSFGISHSFVSGDDSDSWRRALRPNTKAFYVETLTNPLLQVADLKGVVEFAVAHRLVTLIDNTFASPVNFRPAEHGFDITLESGTKYLNGHNDIVAGAVAGSAERIDAIKRRLDHLGGTLDPHACFLLNRGLMTLAVRVRYQNQSALRIAEFLQEHPAVAKVNYPGLREHPQHQRASELFGEAASLSPRARVGVRATGENPAGHLPPYQGGAGGDQGGSPKGGVVSSPLTKGGHRGVALQGTQGGSFGGMISFELKGGAAAADRFFAKTQLAAIAVSLGGVQTLMIRPAAAVHSALSPQERAKSGISDGLIRLSVGLESTDDLIADFDAALGAVAD